MDLENLLHTEYSVMFPLCYHFWSSSMDYSHTYIMFMASLGAGGSVVPSIKQDMLLGVYTAHF